VCEDVFTDAYIGRELDGIFVDDVVEWPESDGQRESIAGTQHQRLWIHRCEDSRIRSSATPITSSVYSRHVAGGREIPPPLEILNPPRSWGC